LAELSSFDPNAAPLLNSTEISILGKPEFVPEKSFLAKKMKENIETSKLDEISKNEKPSFTDESVEKETTCLADPFITVSEISGLSLTNLKGRFF